jgi:hypothetical protein
MSPAHEVAQHPLPMDDLALAQASCGSVGRARLGGRGRVEERKLAAGSRGAVRLEAHDGARLPAVTILVHAVKDSTDV